MLSNAGIEITRGRAQTHTCHTRWRIIREMRCGVLEGISASIRAPRARIQQFIYLGLIKHLSLILSTRLALSACALAFLSISHQRASARGSCFLLCADGECSYSAERIFLLMCMPVRRAHSHIILYIKFKIWISIYRAELKRDAE